MWRPHCRICADLIGANTKVTGAEVIATNNAEIGAMVHKQSPRLAKATKRCQISPGAVAREQIQWKAPPPGQKSSSDDNHTRTIPCVREQRLKRLRRLQDVVCVAKKQCVVADVIMVALDGAHAHLTAPGQASYLDTLIC